MLLVSDEKDDLRVNMWAIGLLSRRIVVRKTGWWRNFSLSSKETIEVVNKLLKYEDNHILVVYKPPRLLVHSDFTKEENLLDMLKVYIKHKYNKPGEVYLGVVHRIDYPCSGLLVFAKTSKAASRLSESFKSHSIHKNYIALVQGEMLGSGELHHLLETDAPATQSVYRRKPSVLPPVKEARLKYQSLGTLSMHGKIYAILVMIL